ncbi:MAG TPA: LysM peptidoglycan-binding domain-containing protein [Longimicrobiales bacterium]|nr:LysM peptidoglycan-binding domain-containing protein [Longimicrobiales bacterium]
MIRTSYGRAWGRAFSAAFAAFILAMPANAQEQPAERREHQVKRGDTLWDLARAYLNDPFLWPMIYEANRQVVENPHRIYPAERLVIPPLPGERAAEAPAPAAAVAATEPVAPNRTRFYAPRETESAPTEFNADGAVQRRRVEPAEYHATPWVADAGSLSVRGSVFRSADPDGKRDEANASYHPFDRLYLSYNGRQRPNRGDLLLVVRVGRSIGGHGSMIEPTGVVRVDSLQASTMMAMVTHQFGSLQNGNLVIPMDSFPNVAQQLTPAAGPAGEIIGFHLEQPVYGTTDRVFLNLGANQVKVGDELVAIEPERRAELTSSQRLAALPIARLLITRVARGTATARVTYLATPALREGMPVRVVARTP